MMEEEMELFVKEEELEMMQERYFELEKTLRDVLRSAPMVVHYEKELAKTEKKLAVAKAELVESKKQFRQYKQKRDNQLSSALKKFHLGGTRLRKYEELCSEYEELVEKKSHEVLQHEKHIITTTWKLREAEYDAGRKQTQMEEMQILLSRAMHLWKRRATGCKKGTHHECTDKRAFQNLFHNQRHSVSV